MSNMTTMSEIQGGRPLTALSMDICIPPPGTNEARLNIPNQAFVLSKIQVTNMAGVEPVHGAHTSMARQLPPEH